MSVTLILPQHTSSLPSFPGATLNGRNSGYFSSWLLGVRHINPLLVLVSFTDPSLFLSMIGPLIKIPCILIAMVGLYMTATPPHPPPSVDEKAPSTRLEVILQRRSGPLLIKVRNDR